MAELLSPGVFIEERPSPIQQVQSVGTSNFASVGWTAKGPENKAVLVTSLDQFFRTFGGFTKYSNLPYAVAGYFNNGGARAYIVRVVPNDALAASADLSVNFKFTAISRGVWGDEISVVVNGNPNYYDFPSATFSKFDVTVLSSGQAVESFTALELTNEDDVNYIVKVLNDEINGSSYVKCEKLLSGVPSDFISNEVLNESVGTGDNLTQMFTHTIASLKPAVDTVKVELDGLLVATDNGEGKIEQEAGSGVTGTIDYETGAVELYFVSAPASGQSITLDYFQAPSEMMNVELVGGSDGSPLTIGRNQISATSLVANKAGIYAFDDVDEFLNMGIADFSADPTISKDLIAYAETRKDVFIVLDCGEGKNPQQAVKYKRSSLNSQSEYGAIYYPRIKVADELNDGRPKVISPVGHIVGCYARTDIEKNVGKNPAGLNDGQLRGIIELERKTSKGERDILYPAGVNPLIEDQLIGKALWGSKTLALTGDFTRINARRLFIFLEKSIFNSTQDLVFENIGAQLWSRIKLRLDGFMSVLFADGYFRGETPEQAFRVVVDESNNPPEIVNSRTVIVDTYVSVNESAEYIRLRFQRSFPTT